MRPWATILLAGLVVGTLDGAAAIIQFLLAGGKDPLRIFVFIASGALGRAAYQGDARVVAAAGLFFHYLIATSWSAIFYLAHRRLASLSPLVVGPLYGVLVWLVMTFVVVPLSLTPPLPRTLTGAAIGIAIHIVCVGLPMALVVTRRARAA